MKALMLCGHGSRDQGAVDEFRGLSARIAARLPDWRVEYGYLEFAKPIIREGLDTLKVEGAREVMARADAGHRLMEPRERGHVQGRHDSPSSAQAAARRHRYRAGRASWARA